MALSNLFSFFEREKLWLKVFFVLAVLIFFLYGFYYVTGLNSLCISCHVIKPYYDSFQESTHNANLCVDCHRKSTFLSDFFYRVEAFRNLVTYFTVGELKPGKLKLDLEACFNCHVEGRGISPTGDIIIDHKKHSTQKGITCLDCHVKVGHRLKKEPSAPKEACYECHGKVKGASDRCTLCHSQKEATKEHRLVNWETEVHGKEALDKGRESCLVCHAKPKGFCKDCHKKRPPSHDLSWNYEHSQLAKKSKEGCFTCHQNKYCLKCHSRPHEAGFLKLHPGVVKAQGASKCFRCHGKKHCTYCHLGKKEI